MKEKELRQPLSLKISKARSNTGRNRQREALPGSTVCSVNPREREGYYSTLQKVKWYAKTRISRQNLYSRDCWELVKQWNQGYALSANHTVGALLYDLTACASGPLCLEKGGLGYSTEMVILSVESSDHQYHLGTCQKRTFSGPLQSHWVRISGWGPGIWVLTSPPGGSLCTLKFDNC